MKKRFVCVLLTLVLLVGLVPVTASAADHSVSESAITVLKQMTKLKTKCYYVAGSEYRTGYGTVCKEKHQFNGDGVPTGDKNVHEITEMQADTALRAYLTELDKKVNSFASQNGLSLTQSQHDALVVFSHGVGTAWMSGTGAVKSAIVSKAGTNELLNAMLSLNDGNYARHQVEVNMYVNGQYSNTIPSSFATVTYHANGGKIALGDGATYKMNYDSSKTTDHIKVTYAGKVFLGWFDGAAKGKWMPKLNAACAGKDLYAYWQTSGAAVEVNFTLKPSELASSTVYQSPVPKAEELKNSNKKTVKVTDTVTINWMSIDEDGTRWGYTTVAGQGGWVKITTPKAEKIDSDVIATATVAVSGNTYLNVRNGAGTDYAIVGSLVKNDVVNLTEIKTVNAHRWGKCSAGWICLTYTVVDMVDGKTVSDSGMTAYAYTGKTTRAINAYVAAGGNNALVSFKDASGKTYSQIPGDTAITIANLSVAAFNGNSATWAKATWKNPELDKNGKSITTVRSAWIPISVAGDPLGMNAYGVTLDPVMYTVVSDTTNVRETPGDDANLSFSLNKGVEVEVSEICLLNETAWGKITVVDPVEANKVGNKTGWINLAGKYVKRSSEVTIDKESSGDHDTGLIATVINTDSVKVRKTGALYGAQMGSLTRGTTVRVWESKKDEWYKVDSNQNGTYDYKGDGWVSAKYLDVREGTIGGNTTTTDSNGNTITTDGTGTGVVANTYSGVNVRQGAGTGYAAVGKLLPGTKVEILEVKNAGAAKWGRTDKGWVCMDYIAMVSYNEVTVTDPSKGTAVDSLDSIEKTSTTAVYTGEIKTGAGTVNVLSEPIDPNATKGTTAGGSEGSTEQAQTFSNDENTNENEQTNTNKEEPVSYTVRTLQAGDSVTIHELSAVTRTVKVKNSGEDGTNKVTTITTTTYWARTNDGWIQNPESVLSLDALDEKVHTVTGAEKLKVNNDAGAKVTTLEKGDQVSVTALKIEDATVYGRVETEEGTGWIDLSKTSEGAYYVNKPTGSTNNNTNNNTNNTPTYGSTGNTGTGGYVTNAGGYKYTGKVINTNSVNVRATASTGATVTTTLKNGASLVIYETTISENMAWGRCDAGWVYLYYVDLVPCVSGVVDARVVYNDNTVAYSDVNCTTATGTYARMSVVDIYEIVGKMAKTDLGWINVDNLL